MKIPLIYNVRSLLQRPVSTALTALAIGMVVAVFVAMLALANGFRAALVRTGSPENAIVLRRGANDELSSGLTRDDVRTVSSFAHVATGPDGRPMLSAEVYVLLNLTRRDGFGIGNVVARGVNERAFEVRRGIRVVAGRRFNSGASEVIVGTRIAQRFQNMDLGDTLEFGGRRWRVVGHFEADGSAFESEVWGENEQFMPVFRGEVFQSVVFRLADPAAFEDAKRAMEADPRLQVTVRREQDFYVNQSAMLTTVLSVLAVVITSIMAIGAVFGAVNTMYAAVATRSSEIGVLLTLGFKPRSVLASFLAESAVIAAVGGALGCVGALPINGLVTSTTNWASFSEVAFAFRVTPALLLSGMIFSVVMGLVGGFFPAWRAARMPVVEALR
ncbi:MAG TPA: ABC transporter permease [Gemmatimonadales bacterium]|nr:ABC transporter permease [Gemmatimonadales bacterium]